MAIGSFWKVRNWKRQPRRPALPFPEDPERLAEIILGLCPIASGTRSRVNSCKAERFLSD
jgi:hypothetical protein